MKKSNNLLRLLAAVLCTVVLMQLPAQVFAAEKTTEYVYEVIISYGEGDGANDSAKNWLITNGYKVLDADLNSGAESHSIAGSPRAARAVYLGYKTTTDRSKAITSLKVMNMTGNYSFDEYRKAMDEAKAEIAEFMDQFSVVLGEWRTNYKAGKAKAIQAYKLLNLMYDDDKGNTGIGTLLLQPTAEEMGEAYNALSDDEKAKHAEMTTILMQGNTEMVIQIEEILAMGADTSSDTWLDRMQENGTYSDMLDLMADEAEENGEAFVPAEAQKKLAAAYDSVAAELAAKMEDLQETIKAYENSGTTLADDESKVDKFLDKNIENDIAIAWVNAATITEILKEIEYPSDKDADRSMYDFVMQDFNPDSAESRKELYPMAASFSEGQKAAVNFVSMIWLITNGVTTNKDVKNSVKDLDEALDAIEPVSVYSGVDRTLFDASSTALTDAARKLQNSSGRSYVGELFGVDWSASTYIAAGIFMTSLVATAGCAIASAVLYAKTAPNRAYEALIQKVIETNAVKYPTRDPMGVGEAAERVGALLKRAQSSPDAKKYINGYEAAQNWHGDNLDGAVKMLSTMKWVSCVLVIITIATGIWSVISGLDDLKEYYNRDFDLYPIPDHIVNQSTDDKGAKVFTQYDVVQCNRTAQGLVKDRAILKDNADLNGDLGKEWLALYVSRDPGAGKPITANEISGFKVVEGGKTQEEMIPLTLFGQENPVNLCNTDWVWNDTHNGLNLYYTVDTGNYTASIFERANPAIITGGAAIIAASIAFFAGYSTGKRRNKKTTAAAV